MGERVDIETGSGRIGGWLARPQDTSRGGIVVIQEIFGLNAHVRGVADRFAEQGYMALAPALFDLVEPHVELGYDAAGYARGREVANALGLERALDGVGSAANFLRKQNSTVAAIGFCWGGTVAFLANTRLGLPAVSYYGARTMPYVHEPLHAPMLFHFGERDRSISAADIATTRAAQPQAGVHVWPAGHGFNCELREDYAADCARDALAVTMAFLERL